jgi:hypothetical protein
MTEGWGGGQVGDEKWIVLLELGYEVAVRCFKCLVDFERL